MGFSFLRKNITITAKPVNTISLSSLILTGEGLFLGFLIGTDAVNDPTITIYDNTEASGEEIVPTNTYDASLYGLNGWSPSVPVEVANGIYVEITCAGACEVTPLFTPWQL